MAIVEATLIDFSHLGRAARDRGDVTVVIHHGVIVRVGPAGRTRVPAGMRVVDGRSMYMLPGLIDGFGSLRTAGFGNAYLFEGVTSVLVNRAPPGGDGEQAEVELEGGPRLVRGETIGGYKLDGTVPATHPWTQHRLSDRKLTPGELTLEVDRRANAGVRGVVMGLDVWPEQAHAILREARRRKLPVTGELAFTRYADAIGKRIPYLLRSDHYQTSLADESVLQAYEEDPNGKPAGAAYQAACTAPLDGPSVTRMGAALRRSRTALMPILSIEATADDVGAPNPWLSPAAAFVSASDLDDSVDRITGDRPFLSSHPQRREGLQRCALHRQAIDGQLHRLGASFLAGSGAPAFGIMPGSGVHQELKLLQHIGLSPRQAIAAATTNYSEILGWRDVGVIEKGRAGDLVLVASDPRLDVAALETITTVIHDGNVVDRTALLAAATARHPTPPLPS